MRSPKDVLGPCRNTRSRARIAKHVGITHAAVSGYCGMGDSYMLRDPCSRAGIAAGPQHVLRRAHQRAASGGTKIPCIKALQRWRLESWLVGSTRILVGIVSGDHGTGAGGARPG